MAENDLIDELIQMNKETPFFADFCEDCPPVGYPTDKTRCASCPRRSTRKDDTDGE